MNFISILENLDNYCKQKHYKRPKYKIVFIDENDYKKLYEMCVEIKGVLTVTETGISRRIAEKKAAFKALNRLKIINNEVVDTEDEEVVNETNDDFDDKLGSEEQINDIIDDEEEEKEADMSYVDNYPELNIEEKSKITKNTVLLNSTPNVVKVENDLKLNNENLNQNNSTPNKLKNEFIDQNQSSNDLELNPINDLIKYCLRKSIPLPFYDFNFNDGMFCTQCRIEINGTEYVGFGKSKTLRVAKIIATQKVIEELKDKNLYFDYNPNEIQLEGNDYNSSVGFNQRFENKFKEYSKVTINMTSTERKIIGTKEENIPIVTDLEDFDDEFDDKNDLVPTPEEAIQRLREVEEMLRKKQEYLEKIQKEEIDIIKKNDNKNEKVSLQAIKRKERIDKQMDRIDETLTTIEYQREALENAYMNTKLLKIMSESAKALKLVHNTDNYTPVVQMKEQEKIYNDIHSSTFISRDDNNNPTERQLNSLDTSNEQNYKLIINNPVSYLQDYCAKNKLQSPTYEQELKSGQEHLPLFIYKCKLELNERQIIGIGLGNNKKAAKKAAAEEVIRLWLKS